MNSKLAVLMMLGGLALGAADVQAMPGGGGHGRARNDGGQVSKGGSVSTSTPRRSSSPLPEPSTVYAVTTSLAVLSGAGWYIRRRK